MQKNLAHEKSRERPSLIGLFLNFEKEKRKRPLIAALFCVFIIISLSFILTQVMNLTTHYRSLTFMIVGTPFVFICFKYLMRFIYLIKDRKG